MPTPKIAVILAGCGVFDGSEIHESTLTLLYLNELGAEVHCFAPNMLQAQVINHYTKSQELETRNVLVESARIARGQIKDIAELNVKNFGGLIVPGGFGAAKNLSDFASKGANCTVRPDVLKVTQAFAKAGKPIGLLCIAPHLAPKIYGQGIICTIGNDSNTAHTLEQMGAIHQECTVDNIIEDKEHKLVTTPAYMLGQSIAEIAPGIKKLVIRILQLTELQ